MAQELPKSGEASTGVTESPIDKPETYRLVIRARILPDPPPAPVRQHSNRVAHALAIGAIAMLALGWIGFSVFNSDPAPAPAAHKAAPDKVASATAASSAHSPAPALRVESPPQPPTPLTQAKPESAVLDATSTSLSAVDEVIPAVPRSALQTIRGTIRVTVRVSVDKQGAVLTATPVDSGPSQYFERLALEAAKQWTFQPTAAEAQRTTLVRFNFTRQGVTARSGT